MSGDPQAAGDAADRSRPCPGTSEVAGSRRTEDPWYEYKTELFRQSFHDGEVKGKAEGKAELVLDIAAKRGIALSASERERIASCTDPDQLSTWALRAATADAARPLF
ncbi:hypothetical protein [Nocardiopsis coralliicola]